jgi:uncharacterized protein
MEKVTEDQQGRIAIALGIPESSVKKTIELLKDGATIPFIARYRKEATGALDEVQLANIQTKWEYYNDLIKRRIFIIETIEAQGKLTEVLKSQLLNCWEESALEDLYLPFKKTRKTKATIAKELGLEPLANKIFEQQTSDLKSTARKFLTKEVKSIEEALSGARDILAEQFNEDIALRNVIRKLFTANGKLISKVIRTKKEAAAKYEDYFDFEEAASKAPAHRILAINRGEQEGLLSIKLTIDTANAIAELKRRIVKRNATADCLQQLELALEDAYKRLLEPSIEREFKKLYKEKADDEAIRVFSENLKQLLLASPLGNQPILGIDPGFRTGCKVVALDEHGTFQYTTTIFPHPPQNKIEEAKQSILQLVNKYDVEAIAIGNGTAGKETYAVVQSISFPQKVAVFMVNESGASIYSASEIAREEFPDLDLTVRGAISIARRLMDPLSELVKIDAKSIGVGQYQHDVNQTKLKADLDLCVVSCVNKVGINLNTASEYVLRYVSGLSPALAKNIVAFRNEQGSFTNIKSLHKVPRMGAKAFEQSAGFLRIWNGEHPLDNTGVHPERYELVAKMAKDIGATIPDLIEQPELRALIQPKKYITDEVGLPTIQDILHELEKPGLDIRGAAKTFDFTEGINSIADVRVGMMVKGIINNVTKFGAFVDLGIKEAGLIHVSQLANRFVSDPLEVVKLNQEVNAKVIEVDIARKRIALSLKDS